MVLSYIENKKWHETRINKNELPSRVQNLEFLSAGYFGTDLGYITATRAPWVSFKDPEGKILVYYKEDNKWHETVMRTK
ncbi:hypothetical protein HYX19_03975 [Candidatus Woesearchaeota archaeon]|nr:hypothetical protein [Candidatus Woesearchaeota archaeon]